MYQSAVTPSTEVTASAERALAAELAGRAQRADGLAAEIDEAANRLLLAAPFAAVIEHSTRARGGLVLITGWVSQRDVAQLEALLRSRLPRPFLLRARDPAPGERPQVPTVVRHPALLRSFAGLVRTYGVPRYRAKTRPASTGRTRNATSAATTGS